MYIILVFPGSRYRSLSNLGIKSNSAKIIDPYVIS